jgi:hypothetical protein
MLLSAITAATVAVSSNPAGALLAGNPAFVSDTTLQRTDTTPPPAPVLRLKEVHRGRGWIQLANGQLTGMSEGYAGSITLAVSQVGQDLPIVDEVGYCFHFVDGDAPDSLTLPAGAWSAHPRGDGAFLLFIHWNDGRTWEQDPFGFRMYVTAMDRAGNESPPSNTVVVEHNGDLETEYNNARQWTEQRSRNESALELLSGSWVGTDSVVSDAGGAREIHLVIRGFRMSYDFPDGSGIADLEVVAQGDSKELNLIDVYIQTGHSAGKKRLGVYRLEGVTLELCLGPPNGKRPRRLERNDGVALLTLVRARTP